MKKFWLGCALLLLSVTHLQAQGGYGWNDLNKYQSMYVPEPVLPNPGYLRAPNNAYTGDDKSADSPPVSSDWEGVPQRATDVLNFWFGDLPSPDYFPRDKMDLWLGDDPEISRKIRLQFSKDLNQAHRGELSFWRETPAGRLALIILLDQFTRHLYTNQPQAFASDPMAIGLVLEGLKKGDDQHLYPIERAFFYLPLEHSENIQMQDLGIEAYQNLLAQSPLPLKPVMRNFLIFAWIHHDQIAYFKRFPHRNSILGRQSTPEEIFYLNGWTNRHP